jgi:hypothetical protein
MQDPAIFVHSQGVQYKSSDNSSFTVIEVLPELKGKPWNAVALAYISGLRPSYIRVLKSKDWQTMDGMSWRVSVRLDTENRIQEITQEVCVSLPENISTGHHLQMCLKYGIKHEISKWYYSDPKNPTVSFAYLHKELGGTFKTLQDGTHVPYPKIEKKE